MAPDPSQVSAVIVTRGNVDLAPILETLIFDEVIVWDNSVERDVMVAGRLHAIERATHRVIYSQDDDIIHPPEQQRAIVSAYMPGVLTGCMWDAWSAGAAAQGIPGGYSDLSFAGSGSIYDREVPLVAAARYLEHFPEDDFFRLWADCIVGVLAPNRNLDLRFIERPEGDMPGRMAHLPQGPVLKGEAIRRARWVRDHRPKRDAHDIYMDELTARLERQRI